MKASLGLPAWVQHFGLLTEQCAEKSQHQGCSLSRQCQLMVHIFKKIRNNHRLYIKDGYGCWVSKGEPSAENSFLLSILPHTWCGIISLICISLMAFLPSLVIMGLNWRFLASFRLDWCPFTTFFSLFCCVSPVLEEIGSRLIFLFLAWGFKGSFLSQPHSCLNPSRQPFPTRMIFILCQASGSTLCVLTLLSSKISLWTLANCLAKHWGHVLLQHLSWPLNLIPVVFSFSESLLLFKLFLNFLL